ncbi:uncharacterized protein ASPGLDRAFT_721498 [Aspergillus glaucus CBS 516.65]|uniref:Uncharacterized protein n=1 Tax=Aspergillus glaucus CBS 516.65 TaxID=1160497 RepID=A0A1L9VXG2_ASPGL|nr:hypothetical protein ASPGLDRAFT_721498 [Aspergillus glaucus CBS 516.65]OJJ88567.1 hypothetical protein ASPGLDRAFT_721498 [Aspergillus glaucus CBS 516.65]
MRKERMQQGHDIAYRTTTTNVQANRQCIFISLFFFVSFFSFWCLPSCCTDLGSNCPSCTVTTHITDVWPLSMSLLCCHRQRLCQVKDCPRHTYCNA